MAMFLMSTSPPPVRTSTSSRSPYSKDTLIIFQFFFHCIIQIGNAFYLNKSETIKGNGILGPVTVPTKY